LALGAAFSFVIMMFNIPIPGGSTGHAVGGVLIAILLGPWAALIAISIALVIQALLFGDGGVTAIAANCFNMAFVMPMAGYWTYRLISGKAAATARRRWIAAGVGAYLGLNLAAVTTAILFGLQPLLARGPDGRPLYFPYPLEVAVPVMALQHLLLFGIIEAVITALLVVYFQRTDPALLGTGCE
jgi:cobalt/nickel transport system permease protein